MQFTDQQFKDAMYQAVERKGPDHTARAIYALMDHQKKMEVPECIVGCAFHNLGVVNLNEHVMADKQVKEYGGSPMMQAAYRSAQVIQDHSLPWKYALIAFEYVLQRFDVNRYQQELDADSAHFYVADVCVRAESYANKQFLRDQRKNQVENRSEVVVTYDNGTTFPKVEFAAMMSAASNCTFQINVMQKAMDDLAAATAKISGLLHGQKKDHTLAA